MCIDEPHWLAEAYAEPIDIADTGHVARNINNAAFVSTFISAYLNPKGRFVDYGAGFGLFVRMMRDRGFDYRWQDAYAKNLFARGFEWQDGDKAELATAFEVFEHLTHPRETVKALSILSDNVLFSTLLLPNPVPKVADWWYYGVSHGQHVSFYTPESLGVLAREFGYSLTSYMDTLHLFHRRPLPKQALRRANSRWFRFVIRKFRPQRSLADADYAFIQSRVLPDPAEES
jgi:hypothetical protein